MFLRLYSSIVFYGLKVAVTLLAASIVTVQLLAEPAHAPVQFENTEPKPGVAVKVTLIVLL